ncbi:hypothetical protein RvY_01563 [Ramazzottius varieornatus]|uniref:Uncharacterized protein n=1 Tax=Ramazzottius varieornatus TaxID=947166 RepID=A0A1D1UNV0_RAMVA|nr:hypothetical protein RvY_01563 [Ramazzottius varieornatus]
MNSGVSRVFFFILGFLVLLTSCSRYLPTKRMYTKPMLTDMDHDGFSGRYDAENTAAFAPSDADDDAVFVYQRPRDEYFRRP